MATNNFFNFTNPALNESKLYHSLVQESIRIHGIDVYYITRSTRSIDSIFHEDPTAYFDKAYPIEMYLNTPNGFGGEGDFLSKFGVEIRDRAEFAVSRWSFEEEITRYAPTIVRPREGDLIFFPFNKKCFEIRFVEHEAMFYNLGELYTFEMSCELFEYSNEIFSTGIPDIDKIFNDWNLDIYQHALLFENGDIVMTEDLHVLDQETYSGVIGTLVQENGERVGVYEDNELIEEIADEKIEWSPRDPFSTTDHW